MALFAGWLWGVGAWASTIDVTVMDPQVVELVLECSNGQYRSPVKNGVASFSHVPNNCQVFAIRRSGVIGETGKWTCDLSSCTQEEVLHREVSDAPGRVNIIVNTALPKGASFELTCPGNYRLRTEIVTNTAVFEGVPDGSECSLFFKGTAPARYNGIGPGTWTCGIIGSTAVCKRK